MTQQLYNFKTLSFNDTDSADIGDQLLSGSIHGVVIEDFLLPSEINELLTAFHQIPTKQLMQINKGFVSYPKSFAQLTQGLLDGTINKTDFFKWVTAFRKNFHNEFGVDIEAKMAILSAKLFPGKKISVPTDKDSFGSFLPFNFRELLPDYGELKVHCENLFFNEFPHFFELIGHQVLKRNDFSYFIVLQQPEMGGELCLVDAIWEDNDNDNFKEIGDTNNYAAKIEHENKKTQIINPPVGSIVVFSGGRIWHKVNVVKGAKSRITLGGFVSSGVDKNIMFMWA